MLLCNYEPTRKIEPLLHFSLPPQTVTIYPTMLTSASVIAAAILIVIGHIVSLLQTPLPASTRRAWRAVVTPLTLAAVKPKKVNQAALYL